MISFRCVFGYHVYRVLRPLLIGGELVECTRCEKKLCIHHGRQQVIPFDEDIQKVESDIRNMLEAYGCPPSP